MKVAVFQGPVVFGDAEANLATTEAALGSLGGLLRPLALRPAAELGDDFGRNEMSQFVVAG